MRKIAGWVALVVVALVLGAGALVVMFVRGTAGVDTWIVRQVVRIANTYLEPDIHFHRFSYTPPLRITLTGVTLTAPGGVRVVEADELDLTLAEAPARGKPIIIERIELKRPVVRLIEGPGGRGFVGLDPFVKGENIRDQSRVDESVRLSNVFRVRRFTIEDGSFAYVPADGSPAMVFGGASLDMGIDPDEDSGEPGWYRIVTEIDRTPVLSLDLAGRFNLDTLTADLEKFALRAAVGPETYEVFPSALQVQLRERDARGRFALHAVGVAPLRSPRDLDLRFGIDLLSFNIAFGAYRLPIAEAMIGGTITDRRAYLNKAEIGVLDGSVLLNEATADFSGDSALVHLGWEMAGIDLREMLRTRDPEGAIPRLAGTLRSTGRIEMDAAAFPDSLSGSGELAIRKGRLVNIPTMSAVIQMMDGVGRITGAYRLEDRADASFDIGARGVRLTSAEVRTQVAAARATGLIAYDGTLDLSVNAGPLERIQGMLGPIGGVLGSITDRLVTYHVTGRAGSPRVTVRPLGVGTGGRERNAEGR